MNPIEKLQARMFAFDAAETFEGYPCNSAPDVDLVYAAVEHSNRGADLKTNDVVTICTIASGAQTAEQYRNARRFLDAYVDDVWTCNMIEGENAIHQELIDAEA